MPDINRLIAASGRENYETIRKGFYQRPEEKQANRLRQLQTESAEYGLESKKKADVMTQQKFMMDNMTKAANFVLSGKPEERANRYNQSVNYFNQIGIDTSQIQPQYTPEVDQKLQMFLEKVKPQSPAGKLASDVKAGIITQEQADVVKKKPGGTAEFERLEKLVNSGKATEAQKSRHAILAGTKARPATKLARQKEKRLATGQLTDDYRLDRGKVLDVSRSITKVESLLRESQTPARDLALQKEISQLFDTSSRAESEVGAWRNFGDLPTRLAGAISRFTGGVYVPEQLAELTQIVTSLKNDLVVPSMREIDDIYTKQAESFKVDPKLIIRGSAVPRYKIENGQLVEMD